MCCWTWSTLSILRRGQKSETLLLYTVTLLIFYEKNAYSSKCPPSNLPRGVRVAKSCKFRFREFCDVICENNGNIIWKKQTRCLEKGKWSALPVCRYVPLIRSLEPIDCDKLPVHIRGKAFCVKVKLPEQNASCPDLLHVKIDLKNCTRMPNSHCIISCGDSYSNLTCLPDGKWSNVPNCISSSQKLCPDPEIGTLVNCSRREGETCQIRCPDGKIMPEDVICLSSGMWTLDTLSSKSKDKFLISSRNSTKWNIISKCTCPAPKLTQEFKVTTDCEDKKIGEKCHLDCQIGYSVIGKKYIVCLKNVSWSSLPICSSKTCSIPELPAPLTFKEDCSAKLAGQNCKLRCNGQTQLFGKMHITCLNGTHWSKLPFCACLSPNLPKGMTTEGNCKKKKPQETCRVKCERKYAISGLNTITCRENGSWTIPSECHKNYCLKPNLPKPLIFSEDCSSKNIGEKCELECLNTQETYEIQCLNESRWSAFPKCSCPTPVFSQNIELKEDCSAKKPGDKCAVSCKELTLTKRLNVICQNNSRWGEEPSCEEFVCPLPILPGYLLFDEDCSYKRIGDRCRVVCKREGKTIGSGTIKCRKGKKWSKFPVCACPVPYLRDDLEATEDCTNKIPGAACKVKCKGKLTISGGDFMRCQNDSTWTSQPTCLKKFCEEPKIYPMFSILALEENCSSKLVGNTCEVFCKQGGNTIGSNFITCLDNLEWSPLPSCTCPDPIFEGDIKAVESCNDKKIGQKCFIECKQQFPNITSMFLSDGVNNFIVCENTTKWSPFPTCKTLYCPSPAFSQEVLESEGSCGSKIPGEECRLKCKRGGNFIGNGSLHCLSNGTWSRVPDCTCPAPVLGDELKTNGNCNSVQRGERCKLLCSNNRKLSGNDYIICQNNTKWSAQPHCEEQSCPQLIVPTMLKIIGDCSSKRPGENCTLRCSEGGKTKGPNSVVCLSSLKWTELPICTCPEPQLKIYLDSEDCKNKVAGENCSVACKDKFAIIEKEFIFCGNDTKWSPQPECTRRKCKDLKLPRASVYKGECKNKFAGDKCFLLCKQGGKFSGEKNYAACKNNGKWSKPAKCFCPPLTLSHEYKLKEDCTEILPGQNCHISCENGAAPKGNDYVTCDSHTQWSSLPHCESNYCPPLRLSKGLVSHENCDKKISGQTCKLNCRNGGILNGSDTIFCDIERSWSHLPECTCLQPVFPHDIVPLDSSCEGKTIGQRCYISCKSDTTKKDYITCLMEINKMWSEFPNCSCSYPTHLYAYIELSGDCRGKTSFPVGTNCPVQCQNTGKIFGSHITCLKANHWTPSPFCACTPPSPSPYINYSNCSETLPGTTCQVSCFRGVINKATLLCDRSYKWETFPMCTATPCQGITFEHGLIGRNCTNLITGDICEIGCANGAILLGTNLLKCIGHLNYQWLGLKSECICTLPILTELHQFKDNCSLKRRGDLCRIGCKNNDRIVSMQCIMEKNHMWTSLPDCKPICPDINTFLSNFRLDTFENCKPGTVFYEGHVCLLRCRNGVLHMTHNYTQCQYPGKWSTLPRCSCTPPRLSDRFRLAENCDKKFHDDICKLQCTTIGYKINPLKDYIKCVNGVWLGSPTCERVAMCPDPKEPLLRRRIGVLAECERKRYFESGDSCKLKCLNGGMYMKQDNIQCSAKGEWLGMPVCSCPPIPSVIHSWRIAEDCRKKFSGDKCLLTCFNSTFRFKENRNFVQCVGIEWKNWPACEPIPRCPPPPIEDSLTELTENCNSKFEGQTCTLKCKHNSPFIKNGTPVITCMPGSNWSTLPLCACVNVTDFGNWRVPKKCDQKRPNEYCLIFCVREDKYVYIRCLPTGEWEAPKC